WHAAGPLVLERGAGLLAREVPARADEAEGMREALRLLELGLVFLVRLREQRVYDLREVRVRRGMARGLCHELPADAAELACVEEDAAALGALVDRHCPLHAPEVAHHHDAVGVARADVALRRVDTHVRVARDVEERLAGRLGLLVEFPQLEMIEPDS